MSNKDLFKEAIADAKAVREAALANAKVALEEALAPKLQSMLSAKLQEMEYKEEGLEERDMFSSEDSSDEIQDMYRKNNAALEEEELEENFDLSEILAELELEEKSSPNNPFSDEEPFEDIKGTEKGYVGGKKDVPGTEKGYVSEAEDEESEEEAPEAEEVEGEEKITDLTVDELKDMIKDIVYAELEHEEEETPADEEHEAEGEDEMSIDLDDEHEKDAMDEEIDLEELLAELDEMGNQNMEDESMYEAKKKKEDEKEMKEAINTIATLRNELNEVNLLNAKLLYVNKIFKAKNLNESQKLKVIAQFDKATTAKEAKAIFESMNSAIAKSAKSTIKESLGFASKAAGVAPKKPIVDETMSRWQMLAGITKY